MCACDLVLIYYYVYGCIYILSTHVHAHSKRECVCVCKLNHTHYGRGMPGVHCVLYQFTPKCVLGQGNLMSTSHMQSIAHFNAFFVIQNVFGQFSILLRCVSTPWLLYSIHPSENFTHVYIYNIYCISCNTFKHFPAQGGNQCFVC